MSIVSAGKRFRQALTVEKPLQIAGAINAYAAIMAAQVGFRALYLSGAGVANASYGMPDLAITQLGDVLIDAGRITSAVDVPLLVDIDTGWGTVFNIARTVKAMIKADVAAVHMEDQIAAKRCGHRPGKELVSVQEMQDRIKAAVDARTDPDFVIMARTDALAVEGLEAALERACAYVAAGADMIFAEAVQELSQYQRFAAATQVPILANITEFGKTPLFTLEQLGAADVSMVLYPLSAFRAMNAAALEVYKALRTTGTQKDLLSSMQTREQLYDFLHYKEYEKILDEYIHK